MKDPKALRNLRFLQARHHETGFDSDYLTKLSLEQLEFMEKFAREFYDGDSDDPHQKRLGNRRRYSAKAADAMRVAGGLPTTVYGNLNPEELLAYRENHADAMRYSDGLPSALFFSELNSEELLIYREILGENIWKK